MPSDDLQLKVNILKSDLYNDISQAQRQINYHIENGASDILQLISDKLRKGNSETLELTKEEYEKVMNYLLCVKTNTMNKWNGNSYLASYYENIAIKSDILNKL